MADRGQEVPYWPESVHPTTAYDKIRRTLKVVVKATLIDAATALR
jgi:hypothetical protein